MAIPHTQGRSPASPRRCGVWRVVGEMVQYDYSLPVMLVTNQGRASSSGPISPSNSTNKTTTTNGLNGATKGSQKVNHFRGLFTELLLPTSQAISSTFLINSTDEENYF